MPKTRRNQTTRKYPLKFTSTGREIKKGSRGKPLTKSFPQTKKTSLESKKLFNEILEDVEGKDEELINQSNVEEDDSNHQGTEQVIQDASGESSEEQVNESQPKTHHYCFLKELDNPGECSRDEVLAYLQQFDLTHQYGPCSGITRMERYLRAVKLDLDPPQSVKLVIDKFKDENPQINHSYLHRYSHIL